MLAKMFAYLEYGLFSQKEADFQLMFLDMPRDIEQGPTWNRSMAILDLHTHANVPNVLPHSGAP